MAGDAPKYKSAFIICDGLGDRPVASLGGKTPTEAANTPTLDKLAAGGAVGLMYPIAPGIVAGSDTAHLALLGFDPFECYTGRGPFECAGIDMDVRKGDVCFRVNFSTVYDDDSHEKPTVDPETGALKAVVQDRRAGRIDEGTDKIAEALDGLEIDGVKILFKESVAHRAGLILRGEGLGQNVSDVDPHAVGEAIWVAKGEDPASEKTAAVLNKFVAKSYEILKDLDVNKQRVAEGKLPANVALPRGVGTAPDLGDFNERNGVKSACIVETGLIRGVGIYLNMDIVDVEGATGGLDSDLQAMAKAVVNALEDHDFVMCNMKGPDIAGHDGDADAKAKVIEIIDGAVKTLIDEGPEDLLLALTGDHSTPIDKGDHGGDAVPFLLHGPGVKPDAVTSFGEGPCGTGSLGTFIGRNVVPILTNLMNVQPKFGA
jgi:2,3-bisphosphoglycerate-independent phosphoglycerate mutase